MTWTAEIISCPVWATLEWPKDGGAGREAAGWRALERRPRSCRRPGFESSSRGWVRRLGQISPSVNRSGNGCCEDHRNTGRAVWSIATHTGLQQMRPLLLLTGRWRGEEAALYFPCRSACAPPACRGLLFCLEASALPAHSEAAPATPPCLLSLPQPGSGLRMLAHPYPFCVPSEQQCLRDLGMPHVRSLELSAFSCWSRQVPQIWLPGLLSTAQALEATASNTKLPGNTDSIHSSLCSFSLRVARLLSAYCSALGLPVQTSYSHSRCPWWQPSKAPGRQGEGAKMRYLNVTFWSCWCTGLCWSKLFSVQSNSVASDPQESFPFPLCFSKGLLLTVSSAFSLYGQKCLKSPRTFLVKPGTWRLWPVLGIPGMTLAWFNCLPTLYSNRKWALVTLVTDSPLFEVLVTTYQKFSTNIFRPPCQGQEEILKGSQVYNTFYPSFMKGKWSIKIIRLLVVNLAVK